MSRDSVPVSPSRVVAAMAHNPNVRKGEAGDGSVELWLTNSGVGHKALQHLRSLGYEITAVSPRFGKIRCVPYEKPVVAPKHDSAAIDYHRGRLVTDGGLR